MPLSSVNSLSVLLSICTLLNTGFAPDRNNVEYLKTRLQEEKDKAAKAEQARLDLEARCQVAERERDVYRLLARRWQSRLQADRSSVAPEASAPL